MSWLAAFVFVWLTALGPVGPVGTLGLELEGSGPGVGTLGLELEGGPSAASGRSRKVGTLGLELESAPRSRAIHDRSQQGAAALRREQAAPALGSLELE